MRISQSMLFDTVTTNLNENIARLLDIQDHLSSGKEVRKPSDDPIQLSAILSLKTKIQEIQRFKENANEVKSRLDIADSSLGNIGDLISRMKVLAIQSVNSAISTSERKSIAIEVDGLIQSLVDNANVKLGQRYVFAGGKTRTQPFTVTKDEHGRIDRVQYNGDDNIQYVEIGDQLTIATNIPGSEIFDTYTSYTYEYHKPPTEIQISKLFSDLIDFRKALESSDLTSISTTWIERLTEILNNISDYRAEIGARGKRLETTLYELQDTEVNLTQLISQKGDIDLTETIMNLQFAETTYQAALGAGARVLQPSLVQFLR